jgi:hypothetical protein
MVGGSVDSNQIHTPVGAGGVYVGGGVDEFAFGSPVREEGDEMRDETSGASPSFPPAESPPSFVMTPATRASPSRIKRDAAGRLSPGSRGSVLVAVFGSLDAVHGFSRGEVGHPRPLLSSFWTAATPASDVASLSCARRDPPPAHPGRGQAERGRLVARRRRLEPRRRGGGV